MLEIGSIVEGKVSGLTNFGAFVSLPDDKSGMVHISEVSTSFVKDIHEHLQVGQDVKVKVIGISDEGGSPPHLICADGTLISVYGHRQRPLSIRAAFSRDRGKTWDVENVITEVETEYGDIGYPCSVALKDGSILTVYYASDDYPANQTFYGFADPERPVRRYTTPVIRQVIWRYEEG